MRRSSYIPDTGDLIWTDFDPTRGREQAGRRPALVVSPAVFTENTGLAVVCPVTSRIRPFPTSVVLPAGLPISGEILTSHIRSIDTQARLAGDQPDIWIRGPNHLLLIEVKVERPPGPGQLARYRQLLESRQQEEGRRGGTP